MTNINIGFNNHGNRGNPHQLTFNGKTQTITEWAKELGLYHSSLTEQICCGFIDATHPEGRNTRNQLN